MVKTLIIKPLGLVLEKAGLISQEQLSTALKDQSRLSNLKVGEILAIRGWIKLETANFFAEQWPQLLNQTSNKPLGQYLKAAALLSDRQIKEILQQQQRTGLKFGSVAVLNGLLAQNTLDFFLEQLELIKNVDSQLNGTSNLQHIENYLLENKQCDPVNLLELYQHIWQQGEVFSNGSEEETELINSGLIVRHQDKLKIAKSAYRSIYNQAWIDQELTRLQPYGKIRLKLFGLQAKASLPYQVLTEVRNWTGNQPFLTQKLYQIIRNSELYIPEGQEAEIVEELVQTHIVDNWQHQAGAEHLKELSDRLTKNRQSSPFNLLKVYKKIWQQGELLADDSLEQAELIDIGLIKQDRNKVMVANRIYQSVFNQSWIEEQLSCLVEPTTLDKNFNNVNEEYESIGVYSSQPKKSNKILIILFTLLAISSALVIGINFWLKTREEYVFQSATNLLQKAEYEKALSAYNEVLKIDGHNYQAWHNRGYALAGLKQYQEMLQSCSSATVINPKAEDSWNCQGEALYNLDRYEEALAAFERAIEINNQEPIFWINKAESLIKLKDYQSALTTIEQAIKMLERNRSIAGSKPVNADLKVAFNDKGQILIQQKEYSQALEAYKKSLKYSPEYLPAQWGKAIALKELGLYLDAKTDLELILQRTDLSSSQRAITWFYQGLNLCEGKEIAAATAAFEMAIKLKPDYETARVAQANCQAGNK